MNEIPKSRLMKKLKAVPPEQLPEVERYIYFLLARANDLRLKAAFRAGTAATWKRIWDNDEDAVYDTL